MKRFLVLLVVFVFISGLVFVSSNFAFAKDEKKAETKKAEETKKVEEPKKAEEPKVVCKFKTMEDMTGFEQLYIAKQATFGRMGVLQAYFAMEQNNLQEIDRQMDEKFGLKMDPTRMYDLNRDTMEIRDMGPVPAAPTALAPAERR